MELSPSLARLVRELVREQAPARILATGALAGSWAELLAGAAQVDVLVRGLDDARSLAGRAEVSTAWCGALDRMPSAGVYDLVLAIGPMQSLLGPDSAALDLDGVLDRLRALAAPGGTVVTTVANACSVDLLVRGPLPQAVPGEWYHGPSDSLGLEVGLARCRVASGVGGAAALYAAYPTVNDHQVLVASHAAEGQLPQVRAELELAQEGSGRGRTEPTGVWDGLERVLDAGLVVELAPAWLAVWRRGEELSALPPLLAGPDGRPRVVRGPLLESVMRRLCATGGLEDLREVLREYAAWVRGDLAPPPGDGGGALTAAADVVTTPLDVVVAPEGLELLDPQTCPSSRAAREVVLARGVRWFSRRLLQSGCPHPWGVDADVPQVLSNLAPMVELDLADDVLAEVDALDRTLDTPYSGGPTRPSGVRDLSRRVDELESALRERQRQVAWLEGTLRTKDRQVRALERTVAVEASQAYRAFVALGRPVPALRRRARQALSRRRDA